MYVALDIDDAVSKVVHAYVVTSDDIDIIKGTHQWQVGDRWQLDISFPLFRCRYNFLVKPNTASFSVACQKHSTLGQVCCVQLSRPTDKSEPRNQVPQT